MNTLLTKKDIQQLTLQDISAQEVERQLDIFRKGIPTVLLIKQATITDVIVSLNDKHQADFIKTFEQSDLHAVKFVPASGAASRMFRILHRFLQDFEPEKEELDIFLKKSDCAELKKFFNRLEDFPFYEIALSKLNGSSQKSKHPNEEKYTFVKFLLEDLDYSNLPKGLIPFHKYDETTVFSAFDEHLIEASSYALKNGKAHLHFTIAEEHLPLFNSAFKKAKKKLPKKGNDYEISYSYQQKSTDTIAVDFDNQPFRLEDGSILLRPGGHGALLSNLNSIDADLIFIITIDNVVPVNNLELFSQHKKALDGILVNVQNKIFSLINEMEQTGFTEKIKEKASQISQNYFHRKIDFSTKQEVMEFFNRPIRICGMVKNEGDPGGGPFWIEDQNGELTLQIIEGAQINQKCPQTQKVLSEMTHFNPVDIVCGVKNYKGEKFDLMDFVAKDQGFITQKSIDGRDLKALELPGLWNGGMAYWNSIFVEVPHQTFNPVKTVLDLLKPGHQVNSLVI